MAIKILVSSIGIFKNANFWGVELVVPKDTTHVVVDSDGTLKYLICKNGDVPYIHPEIPGWGITPGRGSYVLKIGHIEFEGDWRDSLVTLWDY